MDVGETRHCVDGASELALLCNYIYLATQFSETKDPTSGQDVSSSERVFLSSASRDSPPSWPEMRVAGYR